MGGSEDRQAGRQIAVETSGHNSDLTQSGSSEDSRRGLDSQYSLNVEPPEFSGIPSGAPSPSGLLLVS